MINLLRSELFRLWRRPQSWLLLVLASVFMALFYGGMTIGTFIADGRDKADLEETLRFTDVRDFGLSLNTLFGGIMLIILASGLIGNEFGWNTIRPLLARARSRAALLTAKFLTLGIYTVVFSVLLAAITVAFSYISTLVVGESWGFSGEEAWKVLAYVAGIVAINLPGVALAFFVALWARSNAAGLSVAIGIGFMEPAIFGLLGALNDVFSKIEKWGMAWNSTNLLEDGLDTSRGVLSLVILAVYTIIFVTATYVIFRRRDVTSG